MAKQKTNPRRVPLSHADLKRAKRKIEADVTNSLLAIIFRVLIDKHGFGAEQLQELYAQIEDYCVDIGAGKLSINDVKDSLRQEDFIRIIGE